MKKYVKPELFLEEFELSQSVAACGWDMSLQDVNNCSEGAVGDTSFGNQAEWVIYTQGRDVCTVQFDPETYCYEVPGSVDAFRIFRS